MSSYQIIESKSGHKVPKLDDIYLHSNLDPRYEAERFILENEELIKRSNRILMLGLGFAYHIHFLVSLLKKIYDENYHILIIEPNSDLAKDCQSLNLLPQGCISLFTGISPPMLFQDTQFLQFLVERPSILAHPPSFKLNFEYFKSLLTYRSDKSLKTVISQIKSPVIKTYLDNFSPEVTLDYVFQEYILKRPSLENMEDIFFLCLNSIREAHGKNEKNLNH